MLPPTHIDLKKDRGLTVEWDDGTTSYFTVAYLRKKSPCAGARAMQTEINANPLAVLPSSGVTADTITINDAELIGNYAMRIVFSDGHHTGIYSWDYLRSIDPKNDELREARPDTESNTHD